MSATAYQKAACIEGDRGNKEGFSSFTNKSTLTCFVCIEACISLWRSAVCFYNTRLVLITVNTNFGSMYAYTSTTTNILPES